jgi:hypothetical protein
MARSRRVSSKTVLNRKCLTAIGEGLASGMETVGSTTIENTSPPDAAPFGEGLITTGDWGVWNGTRKVGGTATKPRAVKLPAEGITLVVGYGFPGRFQEFGTIHQPARPFLSPAMLETLPGAADLLSPAVRDRLRGVR